MQSFRGVMQDAECPRCHATAPPPETRLATCPRCGLVFVPHELVPRPPPPARDEIPDPPPHVTVRREGPALTISWPVLVLATHVIAIGETSVEHHIAFAPGTRTRLELDRVLRVELRPGRWGFHELHLPSARRRARTLLARAFDPVPLEYAARLIAAKLA